MTVAGDEGRRSLRVFHRLLACLVCLAPVVGLIHCGSGDDPAGGGKADGGQSLPTVACRVDDDCPHKQCENNVCVGDTPANPGSPNAGKGCKTDDDCPNSGCGDDGKCATSKSCTRKHGGRTCGPDGKGDCCAVVTQGDFKVDKYLVTAGRMRAFIEKFDGNIADFVSSLPADQWNDGWAEENSLPYDKDSANEILGPYGYKKACNSGALTGHTYWTPKFDNEYSDFNQDALDEKALNCVPWPLLQAFCAWEGGQIPTLAQLKNAFTNGGTTKYPWGDDDLQEVNAPDPQDRLNISFGFATDPAPEPTHVDSQDGKPTQEAPFFISPPGRYPKGDNKSGVSDSAGNLLEWTGDQLRQFVWKADFEQHAGYAAGLNLGNWWWSNPSILLGGPGPFVWGTSQLAGNAGNGDQKNGYYAIGGRCARSKAK
jgi:formylglycine-generating enzyme required for sulfatase activity